MKLADITDADRLALLSLARLRAGGGSDDDVLLCDSRGWVAIDYSEISDRLAWSSTGCDSTADRVLEEARRLADGMGYTRAEHLAMAADDSGDRHTFSVTFVDMLEWDGLVRSGRDDEGRYFCRATHAGRLVLALRKFSK